MPGPTPTQRIEELRRDLDKLTALVEKNDAVNTVGHKALDEKMAEMKEGVNSFREKFTDFLKSSVDHEGRIKALEKGSDRRWQFAPIVVSCASIFISAVGVVAAIVIALAKK